MARFCGERTVGLLVRLQRAGFSNPLPPRAEHIAPYGHIHRFCLDCRSAPGHCFGNRTARNNSSTDHGSHGGLACYSGTRAGTCHVADFRSNEPVEDEFKYGSGSSCFSVAGARTLPECWLIAVAGFACPDERTADLRDAVRHSGKELGHFRRSSSLALDCSRFLESDNLPRRRLHRHPDEFLFHRRRRLRLAWSWPSDASSDTRS